jgi:hypothetical protein
VRRSVPLITCNAHTTVHLRHPSTKFFFSSDFRIYVLLFLFLRCFCFAFVRLGGKVDETRRENHPESRRNCNAILEGHIVSLLAETIAYR